LQFYCFSAIFCAVMKDFLKKYNILVAPMEGVMRPGLIEVCNDLELTPVWVTPFLRVSESVPKEKEIKKFLAPFAPATNRVILQIMGVDKDKLAETALRGMACGATGIDLNCGCPSHQVVRHGAGGGMLKDPDRTARIIEAISQKLSGGFFSIKTRLGFDSFANSGHILKLWSSAGQVDMFTLHYRTVQEGYRSVPGREARLAAACAVLPEHILRFGNGDITDPVEAEKLCRTLRLDGTMIGRAFWHDPGMLVRHFEPERLSQMPDARCARQLLWDALQQLPFRKNFWSIGNAIETSGLIFGADSIQFREMKARFSTRR